MTTEPRPLLRCERLVIGHEGRALLPAFDLVIPRGAFVAVIGRNGSGKSTWFRTLLGLLPPVSGEVRREVQPLRMAYVPQSSALDPMLPLRARDIVLWGRLSGSGFLRPFASRADKEAVAAALEEADATALADRPYRELSAGQRQRVLLARMLASNAELALLDEPTAAMDIVAERTTMELLARLAREKGMAVVVISHYLGVAHYADQVLFLDREDREVVVSTGREIFRHPAFQRRYGEFGNTHAP